MNLVLWASIWLSRERHARYSHAFVIPTTPRSNVFWSTARNHDRDALKSDLLRAIADVRRGTQSTDVFGAVARLETCNETLGELSGRWALIYSKMTSQEGWWQDATSAVYKTVFKLLPALAGSMDGTMRVQNEQIVDLDAGIVDNVVVLPTKLRLRVQGTASAESTQRLSIEFTRFTVSGPRFEYSLPLPRPRGSISTTFIDDDLRISRGSRGGLFILRRLRSA